MCHTRTMPKHPKRPRDPNQIAKLIVDMSVGEVANDSPKLKPETQARVAQREGGIKGGKARAKKLGPKKRRAIAKKAALARWKPRDPGEGQRSE